MHLETQHRFTAQPRACGYLHAFKGRLGQTLMAESQNTQPLPGAASLFLSEGFNPDQS